MIRAVSDFAQPKNKKFRTETFPPAKRGLSRRRIGDDAPQIAWSLEKLTALAKREHARLNKRQVRVTPRYWRMGRALNLIRRKMKFPRGTWQPWLAAHEITKLNAFRARRLAKFFSSAKQLRRLSLDDALEMAKPKRGQRGADARLCRWLKSVKKKAKAKLDELEGIAAPDAVRALIADARRQLAALDHALAARRRARNNSRSALSQASSPKN